MSNLIKNFFNKTKGFLNLSKAFLRLVTENKENKIKLKQTTKELKNLKEKFSDPRLVIEGIFDKEIKWYDANELSKDGQRNYFRDCQAVLRSDAFGNIKNYLYAMLTQSCVKDHTPGDGLDRVRDAQMTMNGIELLVEELESFPDPDANKKETEEDINEFFNY
uniref:Uncharacterized protein n=1 Tax=viral metagenome TaxID=1070528 RepID=A0A6H1ZXD4_9ZZZZ